MLPSHKAPTHFFRYSFAFILVLAIISALFLGLSAAFSLMMGACVVLFGHSWVARALFFFPPFSRYLKLTVQGMIFAEVIKMVLGAVVLAALASLPGISAWAVFVGAGLPVLLLWVALSSENLSQVWFRTS